MQTIVRHAAEADLRVVMEMLALKAEFDGCRDALVATEEKLRQAFFSPSPRAKVLLPVTDGQAISLATYFQTFSTYLAKPAICLDDLYVREEYRSRGVGKALLAAKNGEQGISLQRLHPHSTPGGVDQFADRDGTRVAFAIFDESGPGAPLDITLEPGRTVRVPIEFETVRPSADAQGFLNVFIQPRRDIPEFVLPVVGKRLSPAELSGSGRVTLRLPAGEYLLTADCFTRESRRLGKAEGKLVVTRGDVPLDARALRVQAPLQQRMAGKPAHEIDATDLDTGKPVRLADFRGKVVVLDF